MTVHLSAATDHDGVATPGHGPGETLEVPPDAPLALNASVSGDPECAIAVLTAHGCVAKACTAPSGEAPLRWSTTGADIRFARVEIRRIQRRRRDSMVALTNPVWLTSRPRHG